MGAWTIALFFTGRKHAGENLAEVLKQRARELPAPIQMCDALSRNTPKGVETLIANCLAHYLDSGIIQSECLKECVKRGEWLVERRDNSLL